MDDNIAGSGGEATGTPLTGGSGGTFEFVIGSGGCGGAGGGSIHVMRQAPSNLSFIEPHEEQTAQDLIDEQFRQLTKDFDPKKYPNGVTLREHAKVTRYFCIVKLFVRPEELKTVTDVDGNVRTIYLPDTVRAEDRYQACVGLVVALGPDAFLDKERRPRGSIYKVGDWLCFSRSDIIRMDFCDVALGIMTDDRGVIVTDDPTMWSMGRQVFKA